MCCNLLHVGAELQLCHSNQMGTRSQRLMPHHGTEWRRKECVPHEKLSQYSASNPVAPSLRPLPPRASYRQPTSPASSWGTFPLRGYYALSCFSSCAAPDMSRLEDFCLNMQRTRLSVASSTPEKGGRSPEVAAMGDLPWGKCCNK